MTSPSARRLGTVSSGTATGHPSREVTLRLDPRLTWMMVVKRPRPGADAAVLLLLALFKGRIRSTAGTRAWDLNRHARHAVCRLDPLTVTSGGERDRMMRHQRSFVQAVQQLMKTNAVRPVRLVEQMEGGSKQ